MAMMIGIPMTAIVLPTGRGAGLIWERKSAVSDREAPQSIVTGITFECTEEPVIHLDRCGATIPTKPSGPQNAVTAPVIRQLLISAIFLTLLMLIPVRTAYSSPKRAMSRPLLLRSVIAAPTSSVAAMRDTSIGRHPEKLPADQL